jgi:hypothetical protein
MAHTHSTAAARAAALRWRFVMNVCLLLHIMFVLRIYIYAGSIMSNITKRTRDTHSCAHGARLSQFYY